MGRGLCYKCSKCGKEYRAFIGVGFMYPTVYSEVFHDMKNGKYGQEMKEAVELPAASVDAVKYLYICKKCNNWTVDYGLSVYDDSKSHQLIKRYVHKCDKCGGVMHRASNAEKNSLKCPECGGAPEKGETTIVCWD